MDIDFEKGTVTIFGKSTKLETMINKFTQLSGEQVYYFLKIRGILVPKYINVLALRSVLNNQIKYLNSNSLSSDYFVRLQKYEYFSEELLYNLFLKIANTKECFLEYRYNLFKIMLNNYAALDFSDADLNHIRELPKSPTEPFEKYYKYISRTLADQKDTFDGINKELLQANLDSIATIKEIRGIAKKYHLDLPERLEVEDMAKYVIYVLTKRGKSYTTSFNDLVKMAPADIEKYAKKLDISISAGLRKSEAVDYLFYLVDNANFETSTVNRVTADVKPLEFRIDMKAINPFGRGPANKVIYYDGDDSEEDILRFNTNLAEAQKTIEPERECVISYDGLGFEFENNPIIDDVIRGFASLSGRQVKEMLLKREVKVPRRLSLYALFSVLNERIKFVKSNQLSNDYFIRLKYYKNFSEEQCYNLFMKIAKDPEAFFAYRYNFFKLFLINNISLKLSLEELYYARNHETEAIEDFSKYYNLVTSALVEQENSLDGIDKDTFKEVIPESAPATEIRQIAKKNGLIIPARLNKSQLIEYIEEYAKANPNKVSIDGNLNEMSLKEIDEFCKQNDIKMSAALTKTEIVTYLFFLLRNEIEHSKIKEIYISKEFIPLDFSVDLDKVDPFGKGEGVKVIHYKGEDLDNYRQEIIPIMPVFLVDDSYFNIDTFNWDEFYKSQDLSALDEEDEDLEKLGEEDGVYFSDNKEFEEEKAPVDENIEATEEPLENNEAEEAMQPEEAEPVEDTEDVLEEQEEIIEEPQEEEAPLEEVNDVEAPTEEPQEEAKDEQPEEAVVENAEEVTNEEASEYIKEENKDELATKSSENEKPEEPALEAQDKELQLNDVIKNDLYDSKKINKLKRSKKPLVIGLTIGGIAVAAGATFIVLMILGIL